MKVEIWSDIICPWCGLGRHRLDRALERFAHKDQVEIIHRSFQLDPNLPHAPTTPRQYLGGKYGMAEGQVVATTRRVEALAEKDGLTPYRVLENTIANTLLAHELLAYASAHGKHAEAWRHLFRVYWGEARSIFGIDALVDLAGEIGLDRDDARRALESHQFRAQVEDEGRRAQRLGASGVPFFVIDETYGVAGAQETDTLLGALEMAWEKGHA